MRRIASNTGPLLHLGEAEALDLLPLVGEVHVPTAVTAELVRRTPNWQTPAWLVVATLDQQHAAEAATWQQTGLLDAGEAEAIALARQVRAEWLLTDDTAARLMAQALGLEAHGSLGIVLWAAASGHLDHNAAAATLDRLAHSSLWLSARVLAEARSALDQM